MAIICIKDTHWQALARAMGHAEWGSDPRFVANQARVERMAEVDHLIGNGSCTLGKEEIFHLSQQHHFPAAPEDLQRYHAQGAFGTKDT